MNDYFVVGRESARRLAMEPNPRKQPQAIRNVVSMAWN